ncbi:hypothetical protein HOLDEFILI_00590 [Holdemania filiformis DSM 12042]|uniref:Uncharacterized protein n=1 Tax=Holdemania filiformis DSM 12042 TaxID=545696 RepID=B9Y458_9FIRM|nr:hypothetical protein HOLDEFILI_00590 [Holdemania filiformis DSM 12042]
MKIFFQPHAITSCFSSYHDFQSQTILPDFQNFSVHSLFYIIKEKPIARSRAESL